MTIRRLIVTGDIGDGQVATAKLADGATTTPKLADGAVTPPKVSNDFYQGGQASVDSVATVVSFPNAFPGTPIVAAVGVDVTDIKVTYRDASKFSWVAAASGTGLWIALYT